MHYFLLQMSHYVAFAVQRANKCCFYCIWVVEGRQEWDHNDDGADDDDLWSLDSRPTMKMALRARQDSFSRPVHDSCDSLVR